MKPDWAAWRRGWWTSPPASRSSSSVSQTFLFLPPNFNQHLPESSIYSCIRLICGINGSCCTSSLHDSRAATADRPAPAPPPAGTVPSFLLGLLPIFPLSISHLLPLICFHPFQNACMPLLSVQFHQFIQHPNLDNLLLYI